MITSFFKKSVLVVFVCLVFILSTFIQISLAQNTVNDPSADNTVNQPSTDNTVNSPSHLNNPLGKDSTLESFFFAILDVILVLAVPIIVFFIIYAGFLYVTAGGSEDKIKKATTAFTWAVVGGVLILGAYVLADVIENTINAFR